jgi:mannose-6-phosphate isomerase-like protein (cupin superfamily)
MRSSYRSITSYATTDGSEIRELMHPSVHGNRKRSFAEATVPPGMKTALHVHKLTEEIYHITSGAGMMTLGGERFAVAAGDA